MRHSDFIFLNKYITFTYKFDSFDNKVYKSCLT